MVIWRYTSAGILDASFNPSLGGYVVSQNFGSALDIFSDEGKAVTFDASGHILVTGIRNNVNADMAVWRYNSNGTPDTTFNGTGYVTLNGSGGASGSESGYGIVIDENGKLVVAGSSFNGSNNDMTIWRINSDGSLDSSFNGSGFLKHNGAAGGNGPDTGFSLDIDSNGRYVVAGSSANGSGSSAMAIWRYQ